MYLLFVGTGYRHTSGEKQLDSTTAVHSAQPPRWTLRLCSVWRTVTGTTGDTGKSTVSSLRKCQAHTEGAR